VTHAQRALGMPGVVLWRQVADRAAVRRTRILPEGCLDLIRDGVPFARVTADCGGWRRPGQAVDSGANRSTGVPSGSRTTA